MGLLLVLILTELSTAAIGGIITFQSLSNLEKRLTGKLVVGYGHDSTSDIPFSHSLDFAQYKVVYDNQLYVRFIRTHEFLMNPIDDRLI